MCESINNYISHNPAKDLTINTQFTILQFTQSPVPLKCNQAAQLLLDYKSEVYRIETSVHIAANRIHDNRTAQDSL